MTRNDHSSTHRQKENICVWIQVDGNSLFSELDLVFLLLRSSSSFLLDFSVSDNRRRKAHQRQVAVPPVDPSV